MHRVPMGRRFGGPEIALIAVALAFAVPLTAWWHGLYRQPVVARAQTYEALPSLPPLSFADGTKLRTFAAMGYLITVEANNGAFMLPTFNSGIGRAFAVQPQPNDPNQTLLLAVAVLGSVAAAVFSMAVYPSIRR